MFRKSQTNKTQKASTYKNKKPLLSKGQPKPSSKTDSPTKSSSKIKFQGQPQTMADLLTQTGYTLKGLKRGDLVEGVITSLAPHEILIDAGAKSEGLVSERDFNLISDLLKTLKVGDKVTAYVISPEDESGHIILSLRKAGLDYKWKTLLEAKEKGEIVTVRGLEVNRGGLIVDWQNLRGFIPASQIDISYINKPQELIGQEIQVKILEIEQKNNRLIFSQKAALSKEDELKIKEKLSKIKIGETYEGVATGVTSFGVFVNIDGVEGLVHISEIAWEKINDPKEHFRLGDKVKVLVLETDKKTGRLNLSIKKLSPDPYEKLSKDYTQQKIIKGEITKLTSFGAFVRLEGSVEGLIHVSKIPPNRELKVGEEVECLIESIDSQKRKISLALVLKEKPVGYK